MLEIKRQENMTQDEAKNKVESYKNIVGQRWKHNYNGTIETVTEVLPIEILRRNDGWAVVILFIPSIENHTGKIHGQFLDFFLENYTKFI